MSYTDPNGKYSKTEYIVDIFTTLQFAITGLQVKSNMKSVLPSKKKTIRIHRISSNTEFINEWEKIQFCDIAIIIGHGNPTQTIKQTAIGQINAIKGEPKAIGALIILTCNAAHQTRPKNNIASAFSKKIYGTVIASDGDVEFPMLSFGQVKFESTAGDGWIDAKGDKKIGNTGWRLYNYDYNNNEVICQTDTLGKTITMESVMDYLLS